MGSRIELVKSVEAFWYSIRPARPGNHAQQSALRLWLRGLDNPLSPLNPCEVTAAHFNRPPTMKIESFPGHHEARDAIVLSIRA
jgi:hypothetical protein